MKKEELKVGDKVRLLMGTGVDSCPYQKGAICTIIKKRGAIQQYLVHHPDADDEIYACVSFNHVEPVNAPTVKKDETFTPWQPKEGEIVWNNFRKEKMKAHYDMRGKIFYTDIYGIYHQFSEPVIEQYIGQTKPINFAKPGLILSDGDFTVETGGEANEREFRAKPIGGVIYEKFLISDTWVDITAETEKIFAQLKAINNRI